MAPTASSLLIPQPQQEQQQQQCHVVLFPFMAKGHTIPLLQLAHLFLRRNLGAVTIITTPSNRAFIANSVADTAASVVVIPFPEEADGVPPGVESTDELPSVSLFYHLANATKLMRPDFDLALRALRALHPPATLLVSDGFLGWTLRSAESLRIPRYVFYGMSNYAMTVSREVASHGVVAAPRASDDEPFPVPNFPWIHLTRNDFEPVFRNPSGPHFDFIVEQAAAVERSHGMVVNSFYELEPVFVDHWNRHFRPKAWCVGPLCLAQPKPNRPPSDDDDDDDDDGRRRPEYLRWLDRKLEEGKTVLYVAFGSQAEISSEQTREIEAGLEESGLNFLWVVRNCGVELGSEGSEGRGMVVREWVDQREVLGHGSVEGFVSHCGWNSVTESLSAGVAVAAWPMAAEQHLNARMVSEELGVGVRVETEDGSVRGFVRREGLSRTVRELMEGETGKLVRKRVKEVAEAARVAAADGGSSWHTLDLLIRDAFDHHHHNKSA